MSVLFHEISGRMVASQNGILLSSTSFQEEARRWVEHQDLSAASVVIVGLGSGFHVVEWLEKNPESRAVIVDTRSQLVKPFLSSFPETASRCDIVIVDSIDGLVDHEVMEQNARYLPPVMMFRPCFGSEKEIFETIFATLTGRNGRGLRYFMNRFGMGDGVEIAEDGRLLTIKDLGLVIDSSAEGIPGATAVRVLRELVA